MNKRGFTLAEVILALLIIGVIATITMPSLIANLSHRDIRAAVQKAYNTLNSAFDLTCIDDSNVNHWATSTSNTMSTLSSRLKITNYDESNNIIYLRDGMSLQYTQSEGEICSSTITDTGTGNVVNDICGIMTVNIKGGNTFTTRPGIETFAFYMTRTGFIPYGGRGTAREETDLYVTGQVIYDGDFSYLK